MKAMGIKIKNTYEIVCRAGSAGPDPDKVLWREVIDNTTVTEGLNDLLTKYFKGSNYTAAWYAGLIDNANYTAINAADTAAKIVAEAGSVNYPTTNNWKENEGYAESVRQTVTLGTASSGSIDNTASKAVFTMNEGVTIKGAFVASVSGKHATTGTLYGAAAFGTAQPVISGNTITLTVTLTAATA